MKIWAIVLFIFFLNFVSAGCSGNQIDINSASLEELDELSGIGEILAGRIIEMRPFDSVDDLIEVERIGEITLQKIKEQGLACIGEEGINKEIDLDEEEDIQKVPETQREIIQINNEPEEETEAPLIKLNAQTIKSEDAEKVLDKSKYPLYGFVGFCILLVVLFIIKARKNKNEFRD